MFRCVSCNKSSYKKFIVINNHELRQCIHCGLMHTDTTKIERNKYIKQQYGGVYSSGYLLDLSKFRKRYIKYISLIDKSFKNVSLLDVGCGLGYFLKFIKSERSTWKIYGVEPNRLLRIRAMQNTGIQVKEGKLESIPFRSSLFNIVTWFDVLEHSPSLKKNILELKRILRPGGILLVQAPNYKSFMAYITGKRWDWWCIPDHVLHFSYDFLTDCFRQNGFKILKSYTYEDQEDFLSNIKALFAKNYVTKVCYIFLIPFFIIIERIGWLTNRGGLTVVLAQKI